MVRDTETLGCGTGTVFEDKGTSRCRIRINAFPPDRSVLDDVYVDNMRERVSALSFERISSDRGNTGQTQETRLRVAMCESRFLAIGL
jgi:hypothetical protein